MKAYLVTLRSERTVEVVVPDGAQLSDELDAAVERGIEVFHEDHAYGSETEPELVRVCEVVPQEQTEVNPNGL